MNPLHALRFIFFGTGLLVAGWLIGLFFFVAMVHRYTEPSISEVESTDAIVVLTGGSERVQTGLDLLIAGKGKKLFISGVHPGLNIGHLLAGKAVSQELRDCCIVLGHAADNTIGNSEETAAWIRKEGFQSLRLVTSHYHMPRSLLLFQAALPDVVITPHAVSPERVKLVDWWSWPGTSSLLILEYNKYLLAASPVALRNLFDFSSWPPNE